MLAQRLIEHAFVCDVLADYGPEKVLDVGTGTRSTLPAMLHESQIECVAIDEMINYWGHEVQNLYRHITKGDILDPSEALFEMAPFDAVTCVCTLEHIMHHRHAVGNMAHLLRPGGVLILTFPYNSEYEPDIYKRLGRPKQYPVQLFSGVEIAQWCNDNDLDFKRIQFSKHFAGDTWGAVPRLDIPERNQTEALADFCCLGLEKAK